MTRKALLRNGLRLMRGAAGAAGLGELQHFLETGFDTFKAMRGAQEFLSLVAERESRLASALFAACAGDNGVVDVSVRHALGQLP